MNVSLLFRHNLLRAPFAERLTYYPHAGAPREITALVETSGRLDEGGERITLARSIDVTVYRVESDAEVGGVAQVQLGDALSRGGDPPASRRWSWTGEVLDETSYSYRLRFSRDVIRQQGARTL